MDNAQFVLNTLVYADQIKAGELTQLDVLTKAHSFGFTKVEVRRELFDNFKVEALEIKAKAVELGIELFYSIPEGLFVEHELNSDFGRFITEAKELSATHSKWNLGEFTEYKGDLFAELAQFDTVGIQLNVENDQSASGGMLPSVIAFGQRFLGTEKLGLVYDIGNWAIKGCDPVEAAEQVKDWVRYIHLKDVSENKVVPLAKGTLAITEVLEVLPKDLPIAFEFRVKEDQELLTAWKSIF